MDPKMGIFILTAATTVICLVSLLTPVEGLDYKQVADWSGAFQKEALSKINHLRSIHQVPALVLDKWLTENAVVWGKMILIRAEKDQYLRRWFRWPKDEGEAIYVTRMTPPGAPYNIVEPMVMSWYCEVLNHNFTNKFQSNSAQFSQLVWKETRSVGIGIVEDYTTGFLAAVARFYPNGNWDSVSSFKKNVFKPTSTSASALCPGYNLPQNGTWLYVKPNLNGNMLIL